MKKTHPAKHERETPRGDADILLHVTCILLIMTFPIVQMVSCRGPPQNTGPQATACLACPIATPLYTITGKIADLTIVQKTIIDTLHKEGKPQTLIAKEAGCSQNAASKHVNRKLSGRKKCENRSLMRIVKQNQFKNLGELHKEWTEAGFKASRATTHRRVKEFGYSCRQRHLTWAKEKKNCCPVVQSPLFR